MSNLLFLLSLFIQLSLYTCGNLTFNNSNCSLSFHIQTISQSNQIRTEFPLEFLANYNLTCDVENITVYYKITPLAILIVGQYKLEDENMKAMVELQSTQFYFNINQSSTIRLCILSADDVNDDNDNNNEHRICRQIHIGINTLYNFWNLPMQIFYIGLICLISTYYVFFFLHGKWHTVEKKRTSKPPSAWSILANEKKNDTFENEKVHGEENSSDEE